MNKTDSMLNVIHTNVKREREREKEKKTEFYSKGFPDGLLISFCMTWLNPQLSLYVVNCDIYKYIRRH
jgi:hypothetical protein